jgi:hypothetical protein
MLAKLKDINNFAMIAALNFSITIEEEFLIPGIGFVPKVDCSTIVYIHSADIENSSACRISNVPISVLNPQLVWATMFFPHYNLSTGWALKHRIFITSS